MRYAIGVDIGTSSSKGVLVDENGQVTASSTAAHTVDRPRPNWAEMDGRIWWLEFTAIVRELMAQAPGAAVAAVGVSGMGPCVLLADDADEPVRPAILYGVDMRAGRQIERMVADLGVAAITETGGSQLTSQAGGPKIAWIAEEEPAAYARARRLYMPASYLVRLLTGAYVLDHQSASQVSPLYDVQDAAWHEPWWQRYADGIEPPELHWAGDVAGTITAAAAAATGLPAGIPVVTGTIDAWSEAASVGADRPGDLFLMYGTTLFLIATTEATLRTPSMWTTVGVRPGSRNLAGGLATAGALTAWVKDVTSADFATLIAEAAAVPIGSRGLLMLPYFAGERTPILDPDARGVIAGLTLAHTRADLYRAALEAVAFGIRHNVETMRAAGADVRRIVAAGGGTQSLLWPQIVSDVTGLTQRIPQVTTGASYGAAFLAAVAVAAPGRAPDIDEWNPPAHVIRPDPAAAAVYDDRYALYRRLYGDTADIVHELAASG